MKFKLTKKFIVALAMAAVLGMSLTACADNEAASGDVNTEDSASDTEDKEEVNTDTEEEQNTDADEETASNASASGVLSKEEYLNEVENLNTVSGNFYSAMADWVSKSSSADTDELKADIENMRQIVEEYNDFTAITNPPEGFEEVHAKLVENVAGLKTTLDSYFDVLSAGLDEEMTDEETAAATEEISQSMEDYVNGIAEGMTEIEELANE